MKDYERVSDYKLIKKMPVILRLDGRAFHTYTKRCSKPFDSALINAMWCTAEVLCSKIENAKVAFVQSDEISILCSDTASIGTQAWFDNRIQKICSVAASLATLEFNRYTLFNKVPEYLNLPYGAMFDCRTFNLPLSEVNNYFIWRQQDWTRNSVQMLAQASFSPKQLNGKDQREMQEMLFSEHGINWNDLDIHLRRGACVVKETYEDLLPPSNGQYYRSFLPYMSKGIVRTRWVVDKNIPKFTEDRDYIGKYLKEGLM